MRDKKRKGVETMENRNEYLEMLDKLNITKHGTKARKEIAQKMRESETERLNAINFRVAPTPGIDSGAGGKVIEFNATREGSEKYRISKFGEADNFANINGRATRVEMKSNSGRIGAIIRALAQGKEGYIVYDYNVCNANTKGETWQVPQKIFTFSAFVALLNSVGAIRINEGHEKKGYTDREYAIQASTKKFYNALKDSPALIYDKNKKYTSEEIARVF